MGGGVRCSQGSVGKSESISLLPDRHGKTTGQFNADVTQLDLHFYKKTLAA